jgi:hypothetical protein
VRRQRQVDLPPVEVAGVLVSPIASQRGFADAGQTRQHDGAAADGAFDGQPVQGGQLRGPARQLGQRGRDLPGRGGRCRHGDTRGKTRGKTGGLAGGQTPVQGVEVRRWCAHRLDEAALEAGIDLSGLTGSAIGDQCLDSLGGEALVGRMALQQGR